MNIFEHYATGENLYNRLIMPVYEKHGLAYMEFTILMFLANNPQYDTAAEIVRYRHLSKSHVSVSVHSLSKKGLISEEYRNNNRKTIHLSVTKNAEIIIRDGRKAQKEFGEILFEGFSETEKKLLSEYIERIDLNVRNSLSIDNIKHSGGR